MLSEVLAVSPEWSAHFLLVLARLSAAIVAAPLLGARSVPAQAKIGLALLLSLIVVPLQSAQLTAIPTNLFVFVTLVGSEVLIGIALGIGVSLVFSAMEMGASLISVQMGFGLGGVFDPISGAQSGALEQFYRVFVTLIFFAMNGHHLVIRGLIQTFEVVPAGTADLSLIAGARVVPFFASLFVAAVQVALPAMGALMLTDLALALVGRTVPQLNVLVVGFPVKIGVGLVVLAASMPLTVLFISGVFGRALVDVNRLLVP
ncbi:MAG: flagellar biosynthetic protein FliR [Dehalococcoidia bacterium]